MRYEFGGVYSIRFFIIDAAKQKHPHKFWLLILITPIKNREFFGNPKDIILVGFAELKLSCI